MKEKPNITHLYYYCVPCNVSSWVRRAGVPGRDCGL